jgi:hypothetical protein
MVMFIRIVSLSALLILGHSGVGVGTTYYKIGPGGGICLMIRRLSQCKRMTNEITTRG